MERIMTSITTRRSVRSFIKDKEVPADIIESILVAGMSAPSGTGRHPVRYMMLEDKALIEKIAKLPGKAPMETSSVNILILADTDTPTNYPEWSGLWVQDCSASMENMLLEAHFQGLGAVWGGIESNKGVEASINEYLDLPANLVPFGIAIMGYSAEEKTRAPMTLKQSWMIKQTKLPCFFIIKNI